VGRTHSFLLFLSLETKKLNAAGKIARKKREF